jgi:5-formyltetrahydrofolate cyclo-ligase
MPDAACAVRSQAICERVVQLPEFAQATCIVGYVSYKKEADPKAILVTAEQAGKTLGLVRIEQAGGLSIHRYCSGDPLIENEFGISEPAADAPCVAVEDISMIIVPALAVDERGQRIGYGRGFYDRLLPRLPRAFTIAVAYDFQLLVETPDTPGDVPVECVVTDKRVLRVARA